MTFKITEQNYRDLFENASDAMWVQDIAGNFIIVNKACQRLTGFNESELLSRNVKEFLVGDSLELARHLGRKLLQKEDFNQPYKQCVIRKDGNIRTIKISSSLVVIDGNPVGFQHVARDVTEEQSITEMLSEITNSSPIPTFVIDVKHKITHWNAALESITGINRSRMLGTDNQWQAFYLDNKPTLADLIIMGATEQDFQAHYPGKFKRSNLVEGAYEVEDFFPSFGSSGKWIHFTGSPIKDAGGKIIAALEALQDITEEKRMHDSMRFYVQLITKAQEEERKRLARDLHDDISSTLLLLIQRLDSAVPLNRYRQRNTTNPVLEELRCQTVDALEHVRRYVQNLRPRILDDLGLVASIDWMIEDIQKQHGIEIQFSATSIEKTLQDNVQLILFRIAQEALINIRRHAKATRVKIVIYKTENNIIMKIDDNGCGFDFPEHLEELIDLGHLGIMGMVERAKLLGGSLDIHSIPGKGTEVTTSIPLFHFDRSDSNLGQSGGMPANPRLI
jgi:PAS domain S-box-containing protein